MIKRGIILDRMVREVISEKGAYAQSFKRNKGASQVRLCWKRNQINHVLLDCLYFGGAPIISMM